MLAEVNICRSQNK